MKKEGGDELARVSLPFFFCPDLDPGEVQLRVDGALCSPTLRSDGLLLSVRLPGAEVDGGMMGDVYIYSDVSHSNFCGIRMK